MFSPSSVNGVLQKVEKAVEIGRVNLKRNYRFHSRVQKVNKSLSKLRKKRLLQAIRTGNPFRRGYEQCCKRYDCYKTLGLDFVFEEYRKVSTLNPSQGKRYLISLYDPSANVFCLKGHPLCAEFVFRALGFSRGLQAGIKGSDATQCTGTVRAKHREVKQKTKRWYISSFIVRLANLYGDFMPNKTEIKLPVFSKTAFWKEFEAHWEEKIAKHEEPKPSRNCFFWVWKIYASIVKVHKNHIFTVCSRFQMLTSEERKHLRDEETLMVILEQRTRHLRFVEREREAYEMRQTMAEENQDKYISIILDGADEKNYGLPHFCENTKSDTGHKLKVKVIGGLRHVIRGQEQLSLYTMTEEYETDANHVLEVAHRMFQKMHIANCQVISSFKLIIVQEKTRIDTS